MTSPTAGEVADGPVGAAPPAELAPVLVIGLGTMGLPIALRLHAAGVPVWGMDSRPELRDALPSGRVFTAGSVRDAVHACRAAAVITCVSDEAALQRLWQAPGGLREALAPGLCVVDHTTTSVPTARQFAADAGQAGAMWVDAPLSGAAAGARAGTLSAMLGGEPGAVAHVRPLLSAYCATLTHLGPAGAGQAGKLTNQIAIAGINAGLLAATGFAALQGLDLARCFDAMAAGSAHSVQMAQHRAALTQAPDDSSLFDWLRRDLALVLAHFPADAAATSGASQALHGRLHALNRVFDGTAAPPLL
ncbi:NAD(P)-dependent oxidoreductase [uncultured Pseudacidovorax sp.]|uniref:NAD(P)-dependent oxidoreductase n=1 Tax=uncultured Pseudacidovorax sp. TaxID=679313 RepID=UPI0025DC1282|nr:NAD(P)-dependent oxidoreductase [uncultured Pseudacidovorax sp.]